MKNKELISEVRRMVSMLESRHDEVERDLNSARGFLAMLERESVNRPHSSRSPTHADQVGDIIYEILAQNSEMHRKQILEVVLGKGVHIGNDDNPQKQLAGLSSILSKDTRFSPVEGRNGFWSLATPIRHGLLGLTSEADRTSFTVRNYMPGRSATENDCLLIADPFLSEDAQDTP